MNVKSFLAILLISAISNYVWADCAVDVELKPNEWKQISLPCEPKRNDDSVTDIFSHNIPGGVYKENWVVYYYNGSDYVQVEEDGFLAQGIGYWIVQITEDSVRLKMPDTAVSTPAFSCSSIPKLECFDTAKLNTNSGRVGWSMMGNPFEHAFKVNDLVLQTNERSFIVCGKDGPGIGCPLSVPQDPAKPDDANDAKDRELLHDELFRWNGSAYVTLKSDPTGDDTLSPWDGFWAATLTQADGKEPILRFSIDLGLPSG